MFSMRITSKKKSKSQIRELDKTITIKKELLNNRLMFIHLYSLCPLASIMVSTLNLNLYSRTISFLTQKRLWQKKATVRIYCSIILLFVAIKCLPRHYHALSFYAGLLTYISTHAITFPIFLSVVLLL